VKNRVHSLLDKYGYEPEWSDPFGVGGILWLEGLKMDPVDRCILDTRARSQWVIRNYLLPFIYDILVVYNILNLM